MSGSKTHIGIMELLWIIIPSNIFILQTGLLASDPESLKKDPEPFCSKGWHPYGDLCYKGFSERKKFENAENHCVELGGHLAKVTSSDVQEFLTVKIVLTLEYKAYIGLFYNETLEKDFWTDGSEMVYHNWNENEPNRIKTATTSENCAEVAFHDMLETIGKWNDISCEDVLPYICEKPKGSEGEKPEKDPSLCSWSSDGIYFRNTCYHLSSHKKTWEAAEKYCVEQYKGHLASVTDVAVQMFLHYAFKNHHTEHSSMWIGIRLKPDELALWSSKWYMGFTNWKDGKTHRKVSSESCGSIMRSSGLWAVGNCDEYHSFICENSTDIPSPLLNATIPGLKCPSGENDWFDLGGDYCYTIDVRARVFWYHANFLCLRKDGTLASIHSENETLALAQFVRYSQEIVHIGLFRKELSQADGEFTWVDHSGVNYLNWQYGEPNNKEEMCVEAAPRKGLKWNDNKCDIKGIYVCSIAKVSPSNTAKAKEDLKQAECECLPTPAIVGVVLCVLVVFILLGIVVYNVNPWRKANEQDTRKRKSSSVSEKPQRYRTGEVVISDEIYENMDTDDKNNRCFLASSIITV